MPLDLIIFGALFFLVAFIAKTQIKNIKILLLSFGIGIIMIGFIGYLIWIYTLAQSWLYIAIIVFVFYAYELMLGYILEPKKKSHNKK
jgi:uncharacterized membrane protein